jgi:hypothetical protein
VEFIDREKELAFLHQKWRERKAQLINDLIKLASVRLRGEKESKKNILTNYSNLVKLILQRQTYNLRVKQCLLPLYHRKGSWSSPKT